MSALATFKATVGTAEAPEFWLCTGIGLLLGAAAAWGAFVFLRRKRMIEDVPTARIRSAPQGYIEIQGHAQLMDGDDIRAPLSTRTCVWYRFKVERREDRQRNGRRETSWVTVNQGRSEDLFYLVDDTGRCAIDPDGAAVTPAHVNTWYGNHPTPGRYHESDGSMLGRTVGSIGKRYRYSERRIEPGDPLYALGHFTTHGSGTGERDVDGAVGDKLRDWKRDRDAMLKRFDLDGDGNIDIEEWEKARAAAREEVIAEQVDTGEPPPVDVLGKTGNRRRPFVIHAGTEAEIVARYRNSAAGLILLALPLLSFSFWALVLRMGGG